MASNPKTDYQTDGPGPANYDVSGLSAKGRVLPRESTMGIRPEPLKKFITPGPGDYDVEKMRKSKLMSSGVVRGFTFGHPNVVSKSHATPGMFGGHLVRDDMVVDEKLRLRLFGFIFHELQEKIYRLYELHWTKDEN